MREAGQLGADELCVGERGFSVGDWVLCLRNEERTLGVLNGERGTVTEIEDATRSLRVAMDKGTDTMLPASYVEAGHLALGYATTVHKSQGMTAERAYVLGSEELYEESPGPEIPADIARRPAWERARVALADLHPPEPAELAVPVEDLGPDLGH
jgi:hypothetical protein